MLPDQLAAFLTLSLVFILMPGPNVLVIIATSVAAGRTRGLQTVAGTASAMIVQLGIAAAATSSLLVLLNASLFWLKWLGASYLLFLGLRSFFRCWRPAVVREVTALGSFQRGFWVSLTNPKTILFFSAFLPLFVSNEDYFLLQIAILSACFWSLGVLCDSGYALLASRLAWMAQSRSARSARIQNGLSGTLYVAASGFLASTNKI